MYLAIMVCGAVGMDRREVLNVDVQAALHKAEKAHEHSRELDTQLRIQRDKAAQQHEVLAALTRELEAARASVGRVAAQGNEVCILGRLSVDST